MNTSKNMSKKHSEYYGYIPQVSQCRGYRIWYQLVIGIIAVLSTVASLGCIEFSGLMISDFGAEDLEPASSKYHGLLDIYEINRGESVTFSVTVKNTGKETVYQNNCYVGIKLTSLNEKDEYWVLPTEQLIGIDLGPEGEVIHTFTVKNKEKLPVSGEFEFQAYIKSVDTAEEIAQSDKLILSITSPDTDAQVKTKNKSERNETEISKIYSEGKNALKKLHANKLVVTAIDAEDLEPTSSKYHGLLDIYEIDHGESVTLSVTVKNAGKETVPQNYYCVGIRVTSPDEGNNYWELPAEQLIDIALGPEGQDIHSFTVKNKEELPVSGEFEFQAYIKSLDSGKETAHDNRLVIKIASPYHDDGSKSENENSKKKTHPK
jgi:hypothetical protein